MDEKVFEKISASLETEGSRFAVTSDPLAFIQTLLSDEVSDIEVFSNLFVLIATKAERAVELRMLGDKDAADLLDSITAATFTLLVEKRFFKVESNERFSFAVAMVDAIKTGLDATRKANAMLEKEEKGLSA